MIKHRTAFVLICALGLLSAQTPPVELTAEQDHERLLALLQIKSLRRGVNARDREAPNAANWDEANADPYPKLPDPLTFNNGDKVAKPRQWQDLRRPEIVELFDREVYGRVPADTPYVNWETTSVVNDQRVAGTPVIVKRLLGRVDNASYTPISVNIEMVLTALSS